MTRKSKREIERSIDKVAEETAERQRERDRETLDEFYAEDVVDVVYALCRDLLAISWEQNDEIANQSEPEASERFLEVFRERYGIDEERDEAVLERLREWVKDDSYQRKACSGFSMAPVGVAKMVSEDDVGEQLVELIRDGREDAAKRLLARETYSTIARIGGEA